MPAKELELAHHRINEESDSHYGDSYSKKQGLIDCHLHNDSTPEI